LSDPRRPALFELGHIEALVKRQPRLSKTPDQVSDIELPDSRERYRADRPVLRHPNEPLQRLHGFGWTGVYAEVEHLEVKAGRQRAALHPVPVCGPVDLPGYSGGELLDVVGGQVRVAFIGS
jgi:hypothetical protein